MDRDPPGSPKAELRDPGSARRARPRAVNSALILLATTIVVSALTLREEFGRVNVGEISGLAFFVSVAKVGLVIGLYVAIWRGSNWARIALLFVVVVSFFYYVGSLSSLMPLSAQSFQWLYYGPELTRNIVPFGFDFVVLYLLFFRGKQWFAPKQSVTEVP
jgi:hypothetical protein